MAGESLEVTTSDLIDRGVLQIGDGYRAKNSELSLSGLPFARVSNINDGFRFDDADHFPESDLAKVGEKISRPGDIVFTSKGTVGRFALVHESTPCFVYSPQLSYWRSLKPEVLHPGFLFYWMQGPEFQLQTDSVKGQTDMADYVSLTDQRRMRLSLPDIKLQRAIARILGSLDDKIELNRRMNRTLEELAAAIFKSWFVDFDPVVARAEGRQPFGMDAETAALFSDKFEESEMGAAPVGWRVAPIGELVKVVGGTTPSTGNAAYWEDGTVAWATPKDLAGLPDPVLLDTERHITQAGLQQISSGLLPAGTVLMSSRAPIGYLAISEIPVAINQGFIAVICDRELPNHYVLHWLRENMEVVESRANGTTFLEISKANFRPIPALVPPEPILQRFTELAGKLHEMIIANARESLTLAAIRDALLPKLMSGEVRVGCGFGSRKREDDEGA